MKNWFEPINRAEFLPWFWLSTLELLIPEKIRDIIINIIININININIININNTT